MKLASAAFGLGTLAALTGCGGLTLNSNFLTKGSALSTSTGALSRISCGTQSITGAQPKDCSVYLSAPAASSVKVALTSTSSALTVPSSVTIQAGASSTGFVASAASVSKTVTVTITGKTGGVSKTDAITLYPGIAASSALSSISCGTQTLTGPVTKACSVYLGAAATSQTVVSLSSNNSSLTVPKSVIVPAGSSSGGFSVTAAAVSTTQNATMTATAGGISLTDILQLAGSGGTGSVQHHVQLSWLPPSTTLKLAGYRVYREVPGVTSYQLLNASIDTSTSYTDGSVQNGTTYNYVVKSVDTAGTESAPSNLTTVTIP